MLGPRVVSFPQELVEADAAYHQLLQQIAPSRYLNPINIPEARRLFEAGAEAPPFVYTPADWAPDALDTLARLKIPTSHPLGWELSQAAAGLALLIRCLYHRDAEHFDALARHADWYPRPVDLVSMESWGEDEQPGRRVPNLEMQLRLESALRARGISDWRVEADTTMSARVLVESSKRLIRINPRATFREQDLDALVAHEIDVHVMRSVAGQRQPLRLFSTGLEHAGRAEEGLAILAEHRVGRLPSGFTWRHIHLQRAVAWARDEGFREVYERLHQEIGANAAWTITLRIKRGLARPGGPGVYAKDTVYLRGFREVRDWLADGGDIQRLYVGKVGLHHPIDAWLAQGWVTLSPVPPLWGQEIN